MSPRFALLMALLALGLAPPAAAQHRPTPLSGLGDARAFPSAGAAGGGPVGWMAVGGVAGGAVGIAGGALLGFAVQRGLGCEGPGEFCGLEGAAFGALAGEVALVPLGVHLANGGRGSYGKGLLASAGVAAGGLALASVTEDVPEWLLWLIPAAQVAASVYVEHRTAERARMP